MYNGLYPNPEGKFISIQKVNNLSEAVRKQIWASSQENQWLSGKVFVSRSRRGGFEPYCVVSLSKTH